MDLSYWRLASAVFSGTWYVVILVVAYNGFVEIVVRYRRRPVDQPAAIEPVTIIRPIKGIDPELVTCLESSFQQNYPKDSLQILLCVDSPHDPSMPLLQRLLAKYPHVDASILTSTGFDPVLNVSEDHYGPNPKVNNLAKGFLAAKHDILWIMDSNVWASPNILNNSVRALNGNYNNGRKLSDAVLARKVRLVHHVPLALSINPADDAASDSEYVLSPVPSQDSGLSSSSSRGTLATGVVAQRASASPPPALVRRRSLRKLGAQLDEMFLFTSHCKFYISLNNLAIAPCVNGKSNIYRKSDLDYSVRSIASPENKLEFFNTPGVKRDAAYYSSLPGLGHAIKFFARYIGEDNMIGIALWENVGAKTGLTGDVVIQPLSGVDNGVADYMARRVRWLRVRKYMVLMATLVEPTTESIICGVFGTYAVSTLLMNCWFYWPFFAMHMLVWMATDYVQYHTLVRNITQPAQGVPQWLRRIPPVERPFWGWLRIWAMREVLALPIWVTAMMGHEIDWRGKPFKIKQDLTAEEL
ncbi:glycosyltransferase family 21 protein [Suhomyces tanzawaensis NRRL Y-17324]|uniref:Ceramide glucosyltransferase n=1 Tax=Suhomyces tanzawaensis NRRL Y-17324 TaxID=984487 RepID=A0A1E4SQA2_9ASCO|nr:glycosyltransferase family 21 protein [Suhomyces tanzawaensis NRRL Y-17324]ODV81694.1 glycosyltransferase family 21 protein [Suhomyces tanzawaensis NRRL Y-17324]